MADKYEDLEIVQGDTLTHIFMWETKPIVYRPISGIVSYAPLRLTVPSHGLPAVWHAAITNVKGPVEINAEANNVRSSDYHQVTAVDANTVEFNDIDAAGYKPYVSGGNIQYNTPVDLTNYKARLTIKDRIGGTELLSISTDTGEITIDPANKTITMHLSATASAAITWKRGVGELEMVSQAGVVTKIARRTFVVSREATT